MPNIQNYRSTSHTQTTTGSQTSCFEKNPFNHEKELEAIDLKIFSVIEKIKNSTEKLSQQTQHQVISTITDQQKEIQKLKEDLFCELQKRKKLCEILDQRDEQLLKKIQSEKRLIKALEITALITVGGGLIVVGTLVSYKYVAVAMLVQNVVTPVLNIAQ